MIEPRIDEDLMVVYEHLWRTMQLYQATLNGGIPLGEHPHTVREIQAALYAIMEECQEAINELPDVRKPWKGPDRKINKDTELYHSFKEETIDIFFMLMRLWLMADMSPEEINELFREKLRKNLIRPDHKRFDIREGGNIH